MSAPLRRPRWPASSIVAGAAMLATAALLVVPTPQAYGVTLPQGFGEVPVIEDLNRPTAVSFSSDGRVFVAEKGGRILLYDGLADATPTVFADLRAKVYATGDRGLLGMTLHPNFPTQPFVYALYAHDAPIGGVAPVWGDVCPDPPGSNTDGCVIGARLVRLTDDDDQAIGEDVLVEDWCQQFPVHSIGDLEFDSDGALYASGGEGASFLAADYGQYGYPEANPCGDPPVPVGGEQKVPDAQGGSLRSQNPQNLSGSVIRIDPETGAGLAGNPMESSSNVNERRIIGYGFRNPFRFAIDPNSDEIYVGNVGSSEYEEIDRFDLTPEEPYNSGWPCYEGHERYYLFRDLGLNVCESMYSTTGSSSLPFFEYPRSGEVVDEDPCSHTSGSALSGLSVYGGGSFPDEYDGALFFADSVRGCIYVMLPGEDGRPNPSTLKVFMADGGPFPGIDLEVGPEGNLYYVSLFGDGFTRGAVHQIKYSAGNQPPIARLSVDQQWGAQPLPVQFDAGESSDPDGGELLYEWDLDGDGVFNDAPSSSAASETYEGEDNKIAAVRVVDEHGASAVKQITIYPDNSPPVPTILAPTKELEWSVGETVEFEGSAEDAEDGVDLPASTLSWSTRLFHCPDDCHAHPLEEFSEVAAGSFAAPDHDYPSYLELTLTATDSRDLEASQTVRIDPAVVNLAIGSDPPGLTVNAGLLASPTPFTLPAIDGSRVTLSAPASVDLAGKNYTWAAWSDGGERVHAVVAGDLDEAFAYVAEYRSDEGPQGEDDPSILGPSFVPQVIGPALAEPVIARRVALRKRPPRRTRHRTARFAFFVNGRPSVGFRCEVDRKRYRPCSSPRVYRRLRPGRHVFRVFAIDSRNGGARTKPTAFRWVILCDASDRRRRTHHAGRDRGRSGVVRHNAQCARQSAAKRRKDRRQSRMALFSSENR